jgi:hypothetical protein
MEARALLDHRGSACDCIMNLRGTGKLTDSGYWSAMGSAPAQTSIFPPIDTSIVYVATAYIAHGRPVLANADTHATIVETCRTMRRWLVFGGVTMPDRCSFLICPWEDPTLPASDFIEGFKRIMRRFLLEHFNESDRSRTLVDVLWEWQKGGDGRRLASGESCTDAWEQMRGEPVSAGLVQRADEWPYLFGYLADGLAATPP